MQTSFANPASAGHLIPASHIRQLAALLGDPESRGAADARELQSVLLRVNAMVSAMLRPQADPAPRRGCVGLAPWQQKRVRDLVEGRIQEGISVMDMAAAVRLSRSFFSRAFSASFGCSPHAYVMEQRINCAKAMMQKGQEPLAQIAVACGLSDQAHLSRLFRRHTGMTPSAWRRSTQTGPGNIPLRRNAALAAE
jgi:transcriptional regulator GlxA family with amidase domain